MPKIVNHEKRKEEIAKATWRVISKQGMKGATVRNIAKEVGMSLGALRYYFSTHEKLLEFAMNLVQEQVRRRIEKIITVPMPPKKKLVTMLMEIIPYNETTRAEMEVWLEFTVHFRNSGHPEKRKDGIREFIVSIFDYLETNGFLKKGRDKDFEIERLYALIDGLAIHAIMEPKSLHVNRVKKVLYQHFDEICHFPK